MGGVGPVVLSAAAFVGTHFLLSHPLRRVVTGALGGGGFTALYSLVAAATLGWLVVAYRSAPTTAPLWPVGDGLWAVASAVMLVAAVLLMGSVVRNPAFPNGAQAAPAEARGVYAVTRHPMMWSFALWAACHVLVYPVAKNIVVAVAIAALALAGAAMQDRKKEALQAAMWRDWEGKTSFWPFAAVAAGRARLRGFGGHALGGGVVVWLAATWAHMPLAGWAAGIWRWV